MTERIGELFASHRNGEMLNPSQRAKILHLLPESDREWFQEGDEAEQSAFWTHYATFRFSLPGKGAPNFEDVMRLLPIRPEFAQFIDPLPGDFIVDLGGGSAQMAQHLLKQEPQIAGYVSLDNHPENEPLAWQTLNRVFKKRGGPVPSAAEGPSRSAVTADLRLGIPDFLTPMIDTIDPARIVYISNWALTYLPADDFLRIVEGCFDTELNSSRPTALFINMLTSGKFDPAVLKEHFQRDIVPANLLMGKLFALARAGKAVPMMEQFGREIQEIMPIWYPEEIQHFLKQRGFQVVEQRSLLWGQSTAMRIAQIAG